MKFVNLIVVVVVSLSIFSRHISAHIFSNVSSIPSWLNKTKCTWDEFQKLKGCHLGDRLHGLSNLKNYLQHFGYIDQDPHSHFNFTDYFDHQLESAITTYQKNFNLNVSGDLDDDTLRQIQRPRCGMPDIINGSTSMNSRNPNRHHFHSVSHYSFFPGMPRWSEQRRDLTYAIAPESQLTDEMKAVFEAAFSRWAAISPFSFTAVESYDTADIKIAFFTGDHGDGDSFDGPMGTLAHAFSPENGNFHFDNDETWVFTSDLTTAPESSFDVESVAMHEIGHLLGLGHSSVEESIMFPTIMARTKKVDLATDDINGIQDLYSSNTNTNQNNNNNPTTMTTSIKENAERDTSKSGAPTLLNFWWVIPLQLSTLQLFFIA